MRKSTLCARLKENFAENLISLFSLKNPQPKKAKDEIKFAHCSCLLRWKYKFDVFSLIASNVFPRLCFCFLLCARENTKQEENKRSSKEYGKNLSINFIISF